MSSMVFSQKQFIPTPPDKGSFPLDHEGVCKKSMLKYMICLRNNKNVNSNCRQEIKDYLGCRMENNLMAKEEWSKLGLENASLLELNKLVDNTTHEFIARIVQDSFPQLDNKMDTITVLVCCTGSVATIKVPQLLEQLQAALNNVNLQVVLTEKARYFFEKPQGFPIENIYNDVKWEIHNFDPLLDELVKNANILLIAPLDANSMAKIVNGICDNLLTSIARVWDYNNKIAICCPAMNTQMWMHPITEVHLKELQSLGFMIIPPITKKLACGDFGIGAMAEPVTIVSEVKRFASFYGLKRMYEASNVSMGDEAASISSRLSNLQF